MALPFTATLDVLYSLLPVNLQKPRVGIVCGSGLSGLAEILRNVVYIPYDSLPGFSESTVAGHESSLAFGLIGPEGVPVVAMLGRFHAYEGHDLSTVVYPIRIMARLGISSIIITNAAGSLNSRLSVGTIVVVSDHLSLPHLTGMNPLLGPPLSSSYPRFMPLSDAYSTGLRRLAFLAANHLSLEPDALEEGVYAWVSGPTYETPAEGRFLRNAGADVVGMSTVPEVVVARQEGLNVMVLTLVTNAVVIPDFRSIKAEVKAELAGQTVEEPPVEVVSHEEVLMAGKQKADVMKRLVERIIQLVPSASL